MYRVILASAPHGHGHRSSTRALAALLKAHEPSVAIHTHDVTDPETSRWARIVARLWEVFSLQPLLRAVYRKFYLPCVGSRLSAWLMHRVLRRQARMHAMEVAAKGADVFVALHPAAVVLGVAVKELTGCRLVVVATDYILHAMHCHEKVDLAFLDCWGRLVGEGARTLNGRGRVLRTGAPVLMAPLPVRGARKIEDDRTSRADHVLVMFGGKGYTGIENLDIIEQVIGLCPEMAFEVVCGSNPKFVRAASSMCRERKFDSARVRVHGFVWDMMPLLQSARVLVGKAGGISLAEAASFGIPVAIIGALPGQEDVNAEVFVEQKAGIRTTDPAEIVAYIRRQVRRSEQDLLPRHSLARRNAAEAMVHEILVRSSGRSRASVAA